jgi:signal transduction histidine kinase
VLVPFALISLQNAYTYDLISEEGLLGHNLNYMALLVGASMFVAWQLHYSLVVVTLSVVVTAYFVDGNPSLQWNTFFVKGGLLLVASAAFMVTLVRTRHNLTVKEIKARIALELSNAEIQEQNLEIKAQNQEIQLRGEQIKAINDNLEVLVRKRTVELEKKNKALEEYAFINAHKLRSPVASILGLVNLLKKTPLNEEGLSVLDHLILSVEKLDDIVTTITKTIERGDRS